MMVADDADGWVSSQTSKYFCAVKLALWAYLLCLQIGWVASVWWPQWIVLELVAVQCVNCLEEVRLIIGAPTLSITTFSIMTLSIKAYLWHSAYMTLGINDTQYNLSVAMMSVPFNSLLWWVSLCRMLLCWVSWRLTNSLIVCMILGPYSQTS